MRVAGILALGMLWALGATAIAGVLKAPSWLVWGLLLLTCTLGAAALGFALFPPNDP